MRYTVTGVGKADVGFVPKNHEERSVPLTTELGDLVAEHKQRAISDHWVFTNADGKAENHFLRKFKAIARRAGLNCGLCKSTVRVGRYDIGLGVRKNGSRSIPPRIFELFPVLKQLLNRRGGDLSGGKQQQLAIGRALILEPKLLILDGPTEGIQPNIVHEIGDIILKLSRAEGLTVLLVAQKLSFAERVASTFSILTNGRRVANVGDLTDEIVPT